MKTLTLEGHRVTSCVFWLRQELRGVEVCGYYSSGLLILF